MTYPKQPGGDYSLQNNNINTSNTTLSFSVSGDNSGMGGFYEQLVLPGFENLLKEHVDRLQAAIRRSESFSLKPFPRYMNQKEVISYLGHEKIFWILVEEYGLKPIRQEHKCNIYCSKQVEEKCIQFEHNIAA
jgi:hypothetical protein